MMLKIFIYTLVLGVLSGNNWHLWHEKYAKSNLLCSRPEVIFCATKLVVLFYCTLIFLPCQLIFWLFNFFLLQGNYCSSQILSSVFFLSCLHSLYLFKLGLAPQIQDLYGKAQFTGQWKNFTLLLFAHLQSLFFSCITKLTSKW